MQFVSAILALVAAVISTSVGLLVWRGDRENGYRRSFVFLAGFVGLWITGNVAYGVTSGGTRYFFALFSYVAAMLLAVQLLAFCLRFVFAHIKMRQILPLIVPGLLMAALSATPGSIAYGVSDYQILTHPMMLLIYGAILVAYILAACAVLITQRSKLSARNRRTVAVILFGMTLSAVIGAYCNLVLPLMGLYGFTLLGPASTVIFIGSVAYAIVKHGLFDVRLAVVRSVTYSMVLATMAAIYLLAAWVLSNSLRGSSIDPIVVVVGLGVALGLAAIMQPLKRFFDRLTNRIFYRDNYQADDFFARLSKQLNTTTELRGLLERAAQEISTTIKAEQGFFAVSYGEDRFIAAGTTGHSRITLQEFKNIEAYINENEDTPIITELLHHEDRLRRLLRSKKIALVLPLMQWEDAISYLFLGDQQSRDYTKRDIRTLETIRDELAIAIQNALSVQEVREINATLQQRIKDATKKLRQSNNQLQRLDAAKDEFVSMASHQLRTPLTSVKGYISMVLEGDVGRITKEQRQLLEEAFTSSERMVHLIGDFLNVSRLQTGKFIIDTHPVDLAKVTQQEVDSIRQIAAGHNVSVVYERPARFPELYLDENKIRQVIMNFMDNAIYYSPDSQEIKITLSVEDGDAVLRVIDKGMGVPVDAQKKLFTKFFRAENARKQRPDGTGIGLYLARKVIDGHGGSLVFESKEDKGSTFGFRLPIKKLATPPAPQQVS
jgi:signal transduction histidine kinase